MDVGLRDMRWAVVAAQHRSLRKAAESLNVRQSTARCVNSARRDLCGGRGEILVRDPEERGT